LRRSQQPSCATLARRPPTSAERTGPMVAGITIRKEKFLPDLRRQLGKETVTNLPAAAPPLMTLEECNDYLVTNHVMLNKNSLENLVDHYSKGGKVNMAEFLSDLKVDEGGVEPIKHEKYASDDPNAGHLALSGVSHLEFGEMYKPYPKHWGVPPNAQMKGHDGIMRELPGGYGKGNAPMFNWVQENLQKDRKTSTDEKGRKPYPYGNYSL